MKSVLISIRPRHCGNIASGKKRIEVRKDRPTIDVPFKCCIYCTSMKSLPLEEYVALHASTGGLCDKWSGKVIGEFICDEIKCYEAELHNSTLYESISEVYKVGDGEYEYNCVADNEEDEEKVVFFRQTCLTWEDFRKYLGQDFHIFYGWHISDLKIYDKPKELGEFRKPCDRFLDCFLCRRYKRDEFGGCDSKLHRSPQSWCYVEESQ